jgi:hypothetical protein
VNGVTNTELRRFLTVTFVAGFAFQLLAIRTDLEKPWLLVAMWAPGIAALTTSAAATSGVFHATYVVAAVVYLALFARLLLSTARREGDG